MLKISLNVQNSPANYSRIPRIKNAKFSRYCFYMRTNVWRNFQICISVPLRGFYQQTDGCTLGGPFSINFSNVYMLNLENNQNVLNTQSFLSVNCFCNPNLRVKSFYCVV